MGVSLHSKIYPLFVFKVGTVKVHRHHVIRDQIVTMSVEIS